MAARILSLAILVISLHYSQQQTLPTAWQTGIATNYGGAQDGMDPSSPSFGTLDGACGFGLLNPNTYPYWSVAALSPSNSYAIAGPSSGCGQCFEIQCVNSGGQFAGRCSSSQSITVTITDVCPQCEADHIDIQALTFNKIAPMALGRIDIQYRRVDCTPPNPVSLAIDNNVGVGGWLRLVVEKTAGFGGISLVQMRTSGTGSWLSLQNEFGSAWEISNTPGLPWDFQFTSDSKQSIQAMSLVGQNGVVGSIPTDVQFSLSGSSGSTPINYDAAGGSTSSPPTAAAAASPPFGINAVTSSTPSTPPTQAATPPVGSQTSTPPAQAATPPVGSQTSSPPIGAQASYPPAASTTTPPASPSNSGCTDTIPSGGLTCAQQQAYGKCTADWMTSGGYCQQTCGNCPGSSSSSGQSSSPPTPPTPTSGSVQTSSINGPPPATANYATSQSTPPASQSTPPACSDNPPPGQSSCSSLAASGGCYDQSKVPSGYCLQSCYRC